MEAGLRDRALHEFMRSQLPPTKRRNRAKRFVKSSLTRLINSESGSLEIIEQRELAHSGNFGRRDH